MEEIILEAKKRDILGKQVNTLRNKGILPGIIYGPHISPIPISLDYRQANRILPVITSSHLVVIDVEGEKHKTRPEHSHEHYRPLGVIDLNILLNNGEGAPYLVEQSKTAGHFFASWVSLIKASSSEGGRTLIMFI